MRSPNYELKPTVRISGVDDAAVTGYEAICEKILASGKRVIAIETYPGVLDSELLEAIETHLKPAKVIKAADFTKSEAEVQSMLDRDLTDDRVRGYMNHSWKVGDFLDQGKIATLEIPTEDMVVIYGVGATLLCDPDLIVYADLARWEIQLRYRRGEIANYCASNFNEDFLRMYKRAYFIDWRIADRLKQSLYERIDFLLDTNEIGAPKMISGEAFREGLKQTSQQPFRVVPYFDSGPWGGQWMKEVCQLDKDAINYAWCFDGVPEENSLLMDFGGTVVEVPSINVVFTQPEALLGEVVHSRFGAEFPIRFDFLDTIEGGNLSLQVHPTTEYIRQHFGMSYTQDESYYMLDAAEDAIVYLGFKDGVNPDEVVSDLERAQTGEIEFDAAKHINIIPTKKHDHFLIPAGTIHCSGAGSMVLEISATPYIFTFKLWDWGRVGLDGKPRPIHLEHGKQVLNYDLTTDVIMRDYVNCFEELGSGDGWREERTGLHKSEFIETRRHWFSKTCEHDTQGNLNVLNLIEGHEAIVESPEGQFEPFTVHYAETFIVPASVGKYTIRPSRAGEDCATLKAFVRG